MNPHAFRHTLASILIAGGTDVVTVSSYLGHSAASFTADIYSHLISQAKCKAADTLAEKLLLSDTVQNVSNSLLEEEER